jgi:hypothetical protein
VAPFLEKSYFPHFSESVRVVRWTLLANSYTVAVATVVAARVRFKMNPLYIMRVIVYSRVKQGRRRISLFRRGLRPPAARSSQP